MNPSASHITNIALPRASWLITCLTHRSTEALKGKAIIICHQKFIYFLQEHQKLENYRKLLLLLHT